MRVILSTKMNKNLSTLHNTDYDSEKDKPSLHPKGEICLYCMGEGVRVSPNPNMDGEYEVCPHCKGEGKLSHNQ